jgi:membrane associated rhomboid family serine protease
VLREDRYKQKMGLGQDGNAVVMLLATIAVTFCLFKFLLMVYWMTDRNPAAYYKNILDWFRLPADFEKMMTRPWTLVTHMVIHDEVFRMIGNVLWLWAFGYILQDLAGNKKLVPIFIYGSLAGAIFFVLTYNLFPRLAITLPGAPPLEGAAAGAMAVAMATTMLAPDYRIFPMLNGGVPLWLLTIIFVVIQFASIPTANAAIYVSLLAGGAMGFFLVYRIRRGRDWTTWMNNFFDWMGSLFDPDKRSWQKTAKGELHYKSDGTEPYKKIANITQKRIDEILDKINQQGYRFLTDEEKEILKRAAEDEEL